MSNKKFILYVRGGNDYTETDACFVEVDEGLAKKVKTRIALAKAAKADDPEFTRLVFWDSSPLFFPAETLGEELWDRVQEEQIFEAPDGMTEDDIAAVRVECIQMHVTEDRVYWACYLKHTDIRMESEAIRPDWLD